jgi:peptidyl-prolyl cis-trans isomerase B (cyclophilin B)
MTFSLDRTGVPCTVASFVSLVRQKFFDNTGCHRITTSASFILQCGDPTQTGNGGPGYTIPDEAVGNEKYPAATLAMARGEAAHSGGSQFFIVYKNSPYLMQGKGQQQYTVFGTVTSGLGVVNKVAAAGAKTDGDGPPKLPITITSMRVTSTTTKPSQSATPSKTATASKTASPSKSG